MGEPVVPTTYSTNDVLHWLDQTRALLEQILAKVYVGAAHLSADERQTITSNLVLVANVVTHLSQHVLRAHPAAQAPETPALAEHPGVLERLHAIHDRMQAVYERLRTGTVPLN
jgi:hypothetical protein